MAGSTVGPFCPIAFGAAKQLELMNWLCPRPDLGSQVRIGLSAILLVPSSDTLLALNVVPGIFNPLRFIPKLTPLLMLKPERFGPLSHCVMPESCQPFRKPAAILSCIGLPNSIEYAALKICVRLV